MPRIAQAIWILTGILFLSLTTHAQSVTIRSITLSGNKHTKASVIFRELTFHEGDTLEQMTLGPVLERNQNNLLNLGIFNQAIVNISEWDTDQHMIDITVQVTESWYIYPAPIFDLADRNFNVWWKTYHHDFSRINLGVRLDWLNLTGRNDKLKAKIQFGFTPSQELEYRFPYFNRDQSLGLTVGASHSINKEIPYATIDNREQFVMIDERKLQEKWNGYVIGFYRPSHFLRYELALEYREIRVDSQVVSDYNPDYFRNAGTVHNTIITRVSFEYDDRDIKIFPARGWFIRIDLDKNGWGSGADENKLMGISRFEYNIASGRRLQHRMSAIGQYNFIRQQPSYVYYQALGYKQNFIRGYELYVVDGMDMFIGKYQLSYKLLEKKIHFGKVMPMQQFREMPFYVYLSLHAETGYVNDPYTGDVNPLANRWLFGGGPGIDLMLYNNFLFQFNYSVNHLGEWGLFFHTRTNF